uniref:Protein kinase domain-containing protein n=1 Tax=Ditylenchus dipsaci TaxID=166011 RepID=A0A915CZR5_9BILA
MPLLEKFKSLFRGQRSTPKMNKQRLLPENLEVEIDPNCLWDILDEIGDGAFGKVKKVCCKQDPTVFAAIKTIDVDHTQDLDDLLVEIEILSQCKHDNLVRLLACYLFGDKLSMALEFCGEEQGVCAALQYLHEKLIIHRDLKASNILLTSDACVKLADFGISAVMKHERDGRLSFIGTPYWMAPEVMRCETDKSQPYDCSADIWSLGITLIEMAQMDPPNHQMSPLRVIIKVQMSEAPTERYTVTKLLMHPFVKDAVDNRPLLNVLRN